MKADITRTIVLVAFAIVSAWGYFHYSDNECLHWPTNSYAYQVYCAPPTYLVPPK